MFSNYGSSFNCLASLSSDLITQWNELTHFDRHSLMSYQQSMCAFYSNSLKKTSFLRFTIVLSFRTIVIFSLASSDPLTSSGWSPFPTSNDTVKTLCCESWHCERYYFCPRELHKNCHLALTIILTHQAYKKSVILTQALTTSSC